FSFSSFQFLTVVGGTRGGPSRVGSRKAGSLSGCCGPRVGPRLPDAHLVRGGELAASGERVRPLIAHLGVHRDGRGDFLHRTVRLLLLDDRLRRESLAAVNRVGDGRASLRGGAAGDERCSGGDVPDGLVVARFGGAFVRRNDLPVEYLARLHVLDLVEREALALALDRAAQLHLDFGATGGGVEL